jgi:hypothetical protein
MDEQGKEQQEDRKTREIEREHDDSRDGGAEGSDGRGLYAQKHDRSWAVLFAMERSKKTRGLTGGAS